MRRRPAWDRMVAGLGVPFDLRHRNELTAAEAAALRPMGLPVVAAELGDGTYRRILDAAALAGCAGDVDVLRVRLDGVEA